MGRDREAAAIGHALREGMTSGAVILVSGSAGLGKTALTTHAVRELAADGSATLIRCRTAEDDPTSLAAAVDLLRPLRSALPALSAAEQRLIVATLAGHDSHETNPFELRRAALNLLSCFAAASPVIVVVDDVAWADPDSAALLDFIARRIAGEPVVLVVVAREADASQEDALRRWKALAHARIRLGPLSASDSRTLAVRLAPPGVAEPQVDALVAAARGVPLVLVETLRHLGAARHPSVAGPPPLEATWRGVLAAGTPAAQHVLLAVALLGHVTDRMRQTLIRGLGLPATAFADAESTGLITHDDGVSALCHPLLRPVTLDAVPAAVRLDVIHRLSAILPAEIGLGMRCLHTTGPDPRLAHDLSEAAADARRRGAYASAARLARSAADAMPPGSERVGLLAMAAEYALLNGDLSAAIGWAEDAAADRGRLPVPLRARVSAVHGIALTWHGSPMAAHEHLMRAGRSLQPVRADLAADLFAYAAMPACMTGEVDRVVDAARELASALCGHAPKPRHRQYLASAATLSGDTVTGRHQVNALPELETLAQDEVVAAVQIEAAAGQLHAWLEEPEPAERRLSLAIDEARAAAGPTALSYALACRAELRVWQGRWRLAEADAAEARDWARELRQYGNAGFAAIQLAWIAAGRGDRESVDRFTGEAFEVIASHEVGCMRVYVPAVRGFDALTAGDIDTALTHLHRARREMQRAGLGNPIVAPIHHNLAEAMLLAGAHDDANRVLAELDDIVVRTGLRFPSYCAARIRALLSDDAGRAEELFDVALGDAVRVGHRFEEARTRLAHGRFLRRTRGTASASEVLREAATAFAEVGASAWQAIAEKELPPGERIGVTPEVGPPVTLTPQELRIAELVAAGRSNLEVAAAVYVSVKTVEAHLTRLYRKLGVRSRTQLIGRLMADLAGPASRSDR